MTNIRVVHGSPDAPAVDIWVDGVVAIKNLSFPKDTGYVELSPGKHTIAVSVSGTENVVLGPLDVDLVDNQNYTVIAMGLVRGTPTLQVKLLQDAA